MIRAFRRLAALCSEEALPPGICLDVRQNFSACAAGAWRADPCHYFALGFQRNQVPFGSTFSALPACTPCMLAKFPVRHRKCLTEFQSCHALETMTRAGHAMAPAAEGESFRPPANTALITPAPLWNAYRKAARRRYPAGGPFVVPIFRMCPGRGISRIESYGAA